MGVTGQPEVGRDRVAGGKRLGGEQLPAPITKTTIKLVLATRLHARRFTPVCQPMANSTNVQSDRNGLSIMERVQALPAAVVRTRIVWAVDQVMVALEQGTWRDKGGKVLSFVKHNAKLFDTRTLNDNRKEVELLRSGGKHQYKVQCA